MNRITDRKAVNRYILLFAAAYLVSYVTRINFGAVVSEIAASEGLLKSSLSVALTGLFIAYGAGQVVSGVLGDRFQPRRVVLCGFILTCCMNLLIPFCRETWQMTVLWCVNGFAQSLMWPPLVRLMASLFNADDYKRACVIVSWGSSVGTILVYLVSPLIISLFAWRTVFFVSAAAGVVMCVVWAKLCPDIEKQTPAVAEAEQTGDKAKKRNPLLSPLMMLVMLAIVLQGALRDGVTTWMPSLISETYDLGRAVSILSGVVLPLFGIASFQVSSFIYRKKIKNPLACSGVVFCVGLVSAVFLWLSNGGNSALSVLFCALLTGSMHGVNLILICMLPAYFSESGHVSAVSGVLNACTYIGSAISTYGIAVITENAGWNVTLIIWCITAFVGSAACLAAAKPWAKRYPVK